MSFKYEIINNKEVKIIDYLGKEENLIIPSFTFVNDLIYKVTGIDKYALNNKYIKRIFIPKTIKKIHLYAFLGFNEFNIAEFIVDEGNKNYSSFDGNLYNKDKTILLRYASAASKTSFLVPEGVKILEDSSFDHASNLKKIILPNSLEIIKPYAFAFCSSLEKINLPESLLEIGDFAFYNYECLQDIKIPSSLLKIGEGTFHSIRKPTLNISVSNKNKAFKVCNGALYSKDKKRLYKYLSGEQFIKLSSTLEELMPYAFSYLYLNEIVLPESLKFIGHSCFIGSTISSINIPIYVNRIEKNSFAYCSFLTDINLKNVREIETQAFYNCKNLSNVELCSSLKYIGDGAFSLTKVNKLYNSIKKEENSNQEV